MVDVGSGKTDITCCWLVIWVRVNMQAVAVTWWCVVGQVRGHVEAQISLIAAGKADKEAVVLHTLAQFAHKFRFFVANIARMDTLFEACFSPLASSGQPPPPPPPPPLPAAPSHMHLPLVRCSNRLNCLEHPIVLLLVLSFTCPALRTSELLSCSAAG